MALGSGQRAGDFLSSGCYICLSGLFAVQRLQIMPDPLGLTANMPSQDALAAILRGCGQDFALQLAVFLESPDPDGPRKARVALRRLTTALDAFEPILRRSRARDLRRRAKEMFRHLGEIRDADVAGVVDVREEDADWLRSRVRKHLRKAKAAEFAARLQSSTFADGLMKSGKSSRGPREKALIRTAARSLEQARERCFKHGTDLSRLSDTKIHDLRKALKAWRYLAEFFAPCWPEDDAVPARRLAFQALQDAFGVLTDQSLVRRRGGEVDPADVETATARAQQLLCALILDAPWWRDPAGRANP